MTSSFAAAMPEWMQRDHLRRQIVPGKVIKLNIKFKDGTEKEKRVVVVEVTANAVCVVINSDLHPILANNPATARAQVPMPVADHPFMSRDSHVNCSELTRFALEAVIDDILASKAWLLGSITIDLRDGIVGALKTSSTIPPNLTAPLMASLARLKEEQ